MIIQFSQNTIIYYQSLNLVTCFGSLSHHQANSQTILKVHSADVHIVGSQMFTNCMTVECINNCLTASIIYKTQSTCCNKSILIGCIMIKIQSEEAILLYS